MYFPFWLSNKHEGFVWLAFGNGCDSLLIKTHLDVLKEFKIYQCLNGSGSLFF